MAKGKFVVLGRHVADCYAVKNTKAGTWDHPWGVIINGSRFGSVNHPNRKGSTIWAMWNCNCTYCPAHLAARLDDILSTFAPIGDSSRSVGRKK